MSSEAGAPIGTMFLLSPARCGGERARQLARSSSELGQQLRTQGAPLGDVFAWLSALYFRGKLSYGRKFGQPSDGVPGALVMVPGLGLRAPETRVSGDMLRTMGEIEVESRAFTDPVVRDAVLARARCPSMRVVLLGSIATGKYLDSLLEVFGARLLFPETFVGRGDMSRGGLLLRAARTGEQLAYRPILGATLHGARPPKLPRLRRRAGDGLSR